MAEYNKERLYFLKLDKDFFNTYDIKIIEKSKHGKESVLFLLKLMCESCSHNGELRYSETQPYTNEMLSAVLDTDLTIVKSAMLTFKKYKIIEINKNGTIIIPKVKIMTESTTKGAIKRNEQRAIKSQVADTESATNVVKNCEKCDTRATKGRQKGDKCRIENKSIDNKNIYSIDNNNFVLDKTNTRIVPNTNNNKKSYNKKSENENGLKNELNDDEFIEYAKTLHNMGEKLDLKFFKQDTDLYERYLKEIGNEE